jgi:hypothetical protein
MTGYDFINERVVDGVLYRAWSDASDPARTYVERGGVLVPTNLRDVWVDDARLKAVFDGR